MKKFLLIICILSLTWLLSQTVSASTPSPRTSYFESEITAPTEAEGLAMLEDIRLGFYKVRSDIEIARVAKTRTFIVQVKREAARRYASGEMSAYEMQDFTRELSYLTHNMNEYFKNIVASERRENKALQALARQNLRDADQSYGRLRAVTWASARR